ncbi:hypothetical protein ACFVUN_22940 [Kitasatospora griseola]|uniref:hypothetical protein n=1 Tax=Kitasatospora griseola TaxID=2064 RepID=UPI0036DB72C2
MDAEDLDHRTRTSSGCIPAPTVTRLLELGHEREVEVQAGRGEWFCALQWARLLGERQQYERALEVLAPYVATDWWPAARARAELLEGWGRGEEAIASSRPYAQAGEQLVLEFFARLLARHGRGAEAFALLRPGIEDRFLAEALVDVAKAAGLDEEAAAMLEARIAAAVPVCDDPDCGRLRLEPFNAVNLLAAIRERQGRTEEATSLLRTSGACSVNGRDPLADLLARHGRIGDLRAYAAGEHRGFAAERLAEELEERGDVDGAAAVYRNPDNPPHWRYNHAVALAQLLARHGRGGEAIEELRAFAEVPGNGEDWIVSTLCHLYAEQGRAEDGLGYLDARQERCGGPESWELFAPRLALMAACGRIDEVAELARAHPEGIAPHAVRSVSDLLAAAGRAEEALAVLERDPAHNTSSRAEILIGLGRVGEAVAVLQQRPLPDPAGDPWTAAATHSTEPPF